MTRGNNGRDDREWCVMERNTTRNICIGKVDYSKSARYDGRERQTYSKRNRRSKRVTAVFEARKRKGSENEVPKSRDAHDGPAETK